MKFVRAIARPMVAGVFINGGYDVLRNPAPRAETASPLIETLSQRAPGLVPDPTTAVELNAALQLVAGAALAVGAVPRVAALALAASLVPTTVGGHRFWEHDEDAARNRQRTQFLKNAAMLGGLLVLAFD